MSENKAQNQRRDQRIVHHMKALQESLGNDEAYRAALHGIRDDKSLNEAQRDAIYKTLAQQSLLWYIEAGTGQPVNVEELMQQLSAARSQQSS